MLCDIWINPCPLQINGLVLIVREHDDTFAAGNTTLSQSGPGGCRELSVFLLNPFLRSLIVNQGGSYV